MNYCSYSYRDEIEGHLHAMNDNLYVLCREIDEEQDEVLEDIR